MKQRSGHPVDDRGFSLVEVIVAIVIASIASVLLIQFMGGNLERSLAPLVRMEETYDLTAVMENITAHYKKLLLTDVAPLATLDTDIQDGNNSDNSPYFGEYEATNPDYIMFSSEDEAPCSGENCRILRVDLRHGEQHITALFTK